jgi:hypothetical protein
MSAVFLEKAFWGFLALVGVLITSIYTLFGRIVAKDAEINRIKTKEEIKEEFRPEFQKLDAKIEKIETRVISFAAVLESFKRNENGNHIHVNNLLSKILAQTQK